MFRWRLPCVGLLLFAGLCPPFVCGLEAPTSQYSSSAAKADLSAAQSAVASQAVSVQGVGQVTIAADAVAAAVQLGAAGAPRKHERRKRLSFAMVHRPRPEGLAAQTPVMNGIGLRQPAAPPLPQRRRIPKIFHQVFVSGAAEYERLCHETKSRLQCNTRDSCLMYLQGWEHKFWNLTMIEELIGQHYPWALDMFQGYNMEVKKADVGRVFILHHYGGLYLDLDCRCFRDVTDSLTDYDFVIQGSGFEGVNNGMMAAAPGLPLWQSVVQILEDRAVPTGDKWKDAPIFQTGPNVLATLFHQYLGIPALELGRLGHNGGVFQYEDYVVKVYPMASWFMPCWITDTECRKRYELAPDPELGNDLSEIAGYHQFTSIWG